MDNLKKNIQLINKSMLIMTYREKEAKDTNREPEQHCVLDLGGKDHLPQHRSKFLAWSVWFPQVLPPWENPHCFP